MYILKHCGIPSNLEELNIIYEHEIWEPESSCALEDVKEDLEAQLKYDDKTFASIYTPQAFPRLHHVTLTVVTVFPTDKDEDFLRGHLPGWLPLLYKTGMVSSTVTSFQDVDKMLDKLSVVNRD